MSSRTKLDLDLTTEADGRIVLNVVGEDESGGQFLAPGGRTDHSGPSSMSDRWTGRWVRVGADNLLRLETRDGVAQAFAHDLRCAREARTSLNGGDLDILRCDPVAAYHGLPWNDSLPEYVRVPLIFAFHGDVLAIINGGEEGSQPTVLLY